MRSVKKSVAFEPSSKLLDWALFREPTTIGVIKGNTRSLGNGSFWLYKVYLDPGCPTFVAQYPTEKVTASKEGMPRQVRFRVCGLRSRVWVWSVGLGIQGFRLRAYGLPGCC